MSLVARSALALLCVGAALPARTAPDPVVIDHEQVGCVVEGEYFKLAACFLPDEGLTARQVRFRSGSGPWLAVELAADGPCYSAVLPRPPAGPDRSLSYYISVMGAGREQALPEGAPKVAMAARVVPPGTSCGADRVALVVPAPDTPVRILGVAAPPAEPATPPAAERAAPEAPPLAAPAAAPASAGASPARLEQLARARQYDEFLEAYPALEPDQARYPELVHFRDEALREGVAQRLARGREALARREFAAAQRELRAAARRDPGNKAVQAALEEVRLAGGEALATVPPAVLDPVRQAQLDKRLQLARLQRGEGKLEAALEELKAAEALTEASLELRWEWVEYYRARRQLARALAALDAVQAMTLTPEDRRRTEALRTEIEFGIRSVAEAKTQLPQLFTEMKFVEGLALSKDALAALPDDPEVLYWTGVFAAAARQGKTGAAVLARFLEQPIRTDTNYEQRAMARRLLAHLAAHAHEARPAAAGRTCWFCGEAVASDQFFCHNCLAFQARSETVGINTFKWEGRRLLAVAAFKQDSHTLANALGAFLSAKGRMGAQVGAEVYEGLREFEYDPEFASVVGVRDKQSSEQGATTILGGPALPGLPQRVDGQQAKDAAYTFLTFNNSPRLDPAVVELLTGRNVTTMLVAVYSADLGWKGPIYDASATGYPSAFVLANMGFYVCQSRYDAQGRLVEATCPRDRVLTYTWEDRRLLQEEMRQSGEKPRRVRHRFVYTGGRLVRIERTNHANDDRGWKTWLPFEYEGTGRMPVRALKNMPFVRE